MEACELWEIFWDYRCFMGDIQSASGGEEVFKYGEKSEEGPRTDREMGNAEYMKDKGFSEAEGFKFQYQEVWVVSLRF